MSKSSDRDIEKGNRSGDATRLGDNITASQSGKELVLRIRLDVVGSRSASGKSMVIGTTRGAVTFAGVQVNVNVYKKE